MQKMLERRLKLQNDYYNNQMFLLLDNDGTVVDIITNTYRNISINKSESIIHLFDVSSYNTIFDNLKKVNASGISFGNRAQLKNREEVFLFFMKNDDYITAFALGIQNDAIEIFDQMMELNNEQINIIRKLNQNIASHTDVVKYLEQIMMINNDLINTRRQLINQKKQLQDLNIRLEIANSTDYLTNIFNRKKFYEDIYQPKKEQEILLINMDLNNFKLINDLYGHIKGDETLIYFCKLLCDNFNKENDKIYRIGGDEFAILTEKEDISTIRDIFLRIDQELSKIHPLFSVSYGIVLLDESNISDFKDVEELIKTADMNMYIAKREKKSKIFDVEEE